jgi:arginine utilization protein RocB
VRNDLSQRCEELALLMTSWPSVTGSEDEAAFPEKLAAELRSVDVVGFIPVAEGPLPRRNLIALRRGRSRRTIVLTGHFDTVPFDDYGELTELACDASTLTAQLIKKLRVTGENARALHDLENGGFIGGRGLLDMKAGLAAGIAALESYHGNLSLVFLAVCDEEERSAGARAAVPALRTFAAEHELEIVLVINLDAISDQGDGNAGRVVTYGSIGKQLVTAYVKGKQAHAGYPQDGINAAYVAAELVTEFELSDVLSERTGNEIAAPPTALFAKDLKQGYNVTTPGEAWVYWNTMQHRRGASEVLALAHEHAKRAIERAQEKTGRKINLVALGDLVRTECKAAPELDLPEQSRLATASVVASLTEPTVVLGFGSIPYPAVLLQDEVLRKTIRSAVAAFGLGEVNYFAGISDMSFFGEPAGDAMAAALHTPIWGSGFAMPEPGGFPCINIGPWGRDYHHWLERLHAPYAFETLPRVLLSVIDAIEKAG